jgi:hypothetical protein
MLLVMFAGMFVLGALLGLFVSFSVLLDDAPALALSVMALNMTIPMVAWMRYRGHGWRAGAEMAASMVGPTALAVALLATGVMTDPHALMGVQHTLMFPAMLAVMLLRRDEYSR